MNIDGFTLKKKIGVAVASIACLILLFLALQQAYLYHLRIQRADLVTYEKENNVDYRLSLLKNAPEPLQESLLKDVELGVNDKFTKSDAYFFVHRYFDNGGDAYEIYDFVQANKALSFMNEAEKISPTAFERLKKGTLSKKYSNAGMHVTLAYLEVLHKYGYADVAALGTLATQYAKMAYFSQQQNKVSPEMYPAIMIEGDLSKAKLYTKETEKAFIEMLAKKGLTPADIKTPSKLKVLNGDILPRNLLVGSNQYAAAVRYLGAYGFKYEATLDPSDMFHLNHLVAKSYVPELEIFTGILDASTLSLNSSSSPVAMKEALQPLINVKDPMKVGGVVKGILVSKDLVYSPYPGTTTINYWLDIYDKYNVVTLAEKVPEFKSWLILNGWKEKDFEL